MSSEQRVGPWLEVLTRTFGGRPRMLGRNLESLLRMTDGDWRQTVLVDTERRGVAWANANLRTVEPVGFYVWVLDDDDECVRPELVRELKAIWETAAADVVVVRMDHGGRLGVLPDGLHWRKAPVEGCIGSAALIVRRAVWMKHRESWGDRYAGDFDYMDAVMHDPGLSVYWHDVVASRTQAGQSLGAAEA